MSLFKPYTNTQKIQIFSNISLFLKKEIATSHRRIWTQVPKVPGSIQLQMVVETGLLFIKTVSISSWTPYLDYLAVRYGHVTKFWPVEYGQKWQVLPHLAHWNPPKWNLPYSFCVIVEATWWREWSHRMKGTWEPEALLRGEPPTGHGQPMINKLVYTSHWSTDIYLITSVSDPLIRSSNLTHRLQRALLWHLQMLSHKTMSKAISQSTD